MDCLVWCSTWGETSADGKHIGGAASEYDAVKMYLKDRRPPRDWEVDRPLAVCVEHDEEAFVSVNVFIRPRASEFAEISSRSRFLTDIFILRYAEMATASCRGG